jgi:hypothetical protein
MSINKHYLKKDDICEVTFNFKNHDGEIKTVKLLGEFNNWDNNCNPMKKRNHTEFSQKIKLAKGKEYQFRYLVNEIWWEDEPETDKFVPNGLEIGEYNSLIQL